MRRWIVILSILMVCMTGCWDKVEINDMAFAIALGIDVKDGDYVATYVFPNLPVYTGQAEGDAMFTRTVQDETMAGTAKQLAAQMNKSLNFEHLEALVLGETLLKDEERMEQLVDYLGRSSDIPKKIPVLASKNAEDVLQPENSESEAVGEYINGIYENNQSVVRNYKLTLQKALQSMNEEQCLLIPILYAQDSTLMISDAVVYHDGAVVGILDMEELEALSWLREYAEGMEFAIALEGGHISLEIESASCRYTYEELEGCFRIHAMVEARAQIREYQSAEDTDLLDEEMIQHLEQEAEEEMCKDMEDVVRTMQEDYGTDLAFMIDPLRFRDRDLYLAMENRWDAMFPEMEFSAEADVTIEKIGIENE